MSGPHDWPQTVLDDHERRLRSLERWMYRWGGATALVLVAVAAATGVIDLVATLHLLP